MAAYSADQLLGTEVSEERAAQIRTEMDAALNAGRSHEDLDMEHGRKMWAACESLTSGKAST